MSELHIALGNKLYSSWSLRAYMVLRGFGIPFSETVIDMYRDDTKERMLAFGPTGKVPVIKRGDITVWESLAIIETIAEWFPEKAVWPSDAAARAHARAACSEMHAGFTALRSNCPMNLTARFKPREWDDDFMADVTRLDNLWSEAMEQFGQGGPFLYGGFSAADCMYAPVVSRLDTYQIPVSNRMRTYMDAVLAHPAFLQWKEEAFGEPWFLGHYEEGYEVETRFVMPSEKVT